MNKDAGRLYSIHHMTLTWIQTLNHCIKSRRPCYQVSSVGYGNKAFPVMTQIMLGVSCIFYSFHCNCLS